MNPQYEAAARRKRMRDTARALARSGQHPDHRSIFAQLEVIDGFADARDQLRIIRSQLDHLCAMAHSRRARIDLPGR